MLSRLVDLHHAIATKRTAGGEVRRRKGRPVAGRPGPDADHQGPDSPADLRRNHRRGRRPGTHARGPRGSRRQQPVQAGQPALCRPGSACPSLIARAVKDITIQLVRNAVVHGIEEPTERTKANKAAAGALAVEFTPAR